jgi:radical SAM superfamily enzyme YgiQ (UPF0313 family)
LFQHVDIIVVVDDCSTDQTVSKITGKYTGGEGIEDIDALPYPARDLVDIRAYELPPHFSQGKLSATILTSRGCPSACTFCGNQTMGRAFRAHSPQYVVDEIQYLINKYGITHFHVVDDCFTIDEKRVVEICNLIIERGLKISFFIFGRVNNLQKEYVITKLKKAGCVMILLGIESGNEELLKIMRKGTSLAMIKRCCDLLRRNNMHFVSSFIIGNEGETVQTVEETIALAKALKSNWVSLNILVPFPGTPIFHKFFKDYDNPDMNWDGFCCFSGNIPYEIRQTVLTSQELSTLIKRAYRSVYVNISQLWRVFVCIKKPVVLLGYIRQAFHLFLFLVFFNRNGNTRPVKINKNHK